VDTTQVSRGQIVMGIAKESESKGIGIQPSDSSAANGGEPEPQVGKVAGKQGGAPKPKPNTKAKAKLGGERKEDGGDCPLDQTCGT